jgi:probable rRNA maturation factor
MKRPLAVVVRNAQRKRAVDVPSLQQFAERASVLCCETNTKGENELERLEEVTIVLVSDRRMAALHKQFMNIAGPTDVLTFQHGEIFVSVDTAEQNAAQFKTTPDNEIRLYIVHGLLHLRGFDDRDAKRARRMNSTQQRILVAASAA